MMALYPMPTILVGALIDGKPNYMPIAHVGIADFNHVSLSMGRQHYTNIGIKSNGTFGMSMPSEAMVKETDYCGIVSGSKEDKSGLFKTFYGELETAPMIEECPLTMECKLIQTVELERHDVLIGEIVRTYVEEEYLTDGKPDFMKIAPILFIPTADYFSLGARFASAWNIGKELKKS
jgi:flavin reductase (DIM6/NTAB) family NADH-FMN oxidoreductase RutF